MPNWCYNTLAISGEPKQLNKFVKELEVTESEESDLSEASKFSFDKVIPQPDNLNDNWYEWRIGNWGTKWNADVQYENFDQWESGDISIDFNTAWSAPMPILKKLVEMYPKLTFNWRCYEESHAFWGIGEGVKGKLEVEWGNFNTCKEYNDFGLTHHICTGCDEWLDEWCDNSNTQKGLCDECAPKIEANEEELWESA